MITLNGRSLTQREFLRLVFITTDAVNRERDVHVTPVHILSEEYQANFEKEWLVEFASGEVLEFDTEDQACAFQRDWRAVTGRDPMTGDLLP
jgi:hypothetical protein